MVVLRHTTTIQGYYYWLAGAALAVALFALVPPWVPPLPAPAASTALLEEAPAAVSGVLDNDLDNDGKVDGTADSLGAHLNGIANPLVGLVLVSLLIPSVTGRLLTLSLYELPMVGCEYYLPLERPG